MRQRKYVAYVGTYTHEKSVGIHIYDVDVERGTLSERKVVPISNPSDVVVSKNHKFLYSIADEGVEKCYLGRPWRPYAYTLFMNCELGKHIRPTGWDNWRNPENEKTARYMEYNNSGEGAATKERCAWAKQLTKKEAAKLTVQEVFSINNTWDPQK